MLTNKEPLTDSILEISQIYHPSLRIKMAWLKKSFSRIIHKGGANQYFWISIYKLFYKLTSIIDQNMVNEEVRLFPYLQERESENKKIPKAGESKTFTGLENEHLFISQQWLALQKEVGGYQPSSDDKELVEEIRHQLVEFEKTLAEHEIFEREHIYHRT